MKKRFDKCFFNPLEENLLKTFPRLKELLPAKGTLEEDPLSGEGERLVRYIIALYDPKSPLIKDHPDLGSRKVAAAELVGYDLGKDQTKLELIYLCDSEYMVTIIVNFFRYIVKSWLWASLQADEQTFWEFIYRLMMPIKSDKGDKDQVQAVAVKTKLSEDKEHIISRIEANWNKLLGDDDDLKKKAKALNYSPEAMAGIIR